MDGKDSSCHHGSHEDLLKSPSETPASGPGVDAIFVPTARPPAYLGEAAKLAKTLTCPLVTLHSHKWTSATLAAKHLHNMDISDTVQLIAIDVPGLEGLNLPDWRTSRLVADTVFARKTDLSDKRNLALMFSQMVGWSRILFLDDDITGLRADDVRTASGLLDEYNAVGLRIDGFPDNSVVCHAYRDAGGQQRSFVGGGALAIVNRCRSFFPDIYNDDWFFLLDGEQKLQPTVRTGQVIQNPYDPFRNPDRARAEEFGDALAEGIFWLLDHNLSIQGADRWHWMRFLDKRRSFIRKVLEMVKNDELDEAERGRRIEALKGSLGRLTHITPDFCVSYLEAWLADRDEWQRHLEFLPTDLPVDKAIDTLSRDGHPRLRRHIADSVMCVPTA